tara:strand:+ start:366 stop:3101 length:2736 start_codon:yes stop_codon:yes gene_type:complete
MKYQNPKTTFLKDYEPPKFLIDNIELYIDLYEDWCSVKATMKFRKNPVSSVNSKELILNGEKIKLKSIFINDIKLKKNQYHTDNYQLTIFDVPEEFVLKTEVFIQPQKNTELEGLYKSGSIFCTQCESEGFRKITYFLDRPDVMSLYRTTISADSNLYPILLSNGNLIDSGKLSEDRHWVKWEDPHPKPSYLFALVAGDLKYIEDSYKTSSGKNVTLRIFVESENIEYCDHAMQSLKESMLWDENRFGREYDLDLFMIVAVNDFNMGAMENKGLNIFNSKLILASKETATDTDFSNIQGVVGHEYFHNWSGNRVTCRDWFQLSLKEGFTVFRDQEFSADMNSRAVQRINDVDRLRIYQFPEDAGPMSHPIRPDSYIEINNFYTMTVYEKGAEVVRMLFSLLGEDGFRKGTDLYFNRHDGQAVTCDNFIASLEDSNGVNLNQFKRWYSQSGTPVLNVSGSYNSLSKTYTLNVSQSCPDSPGQRGFGTEIKNSERIYKKEVKEVNPKNKNILQKEPFHIPLAIGLINQDGEDISIESTNFSKIKKQKTIILEILKENEKFVFENISAKPIPSLLRSFSAPVKLNFDYSNEDLAFLMKNDSDEFNRWDAGQKLMIRVTLEQLELLKSGKKLYLPPELEDAFQSILNQSDNSNAALIALALSFPSESYLAEFMCAIDFDAIYKARSFLKKTLAQKLHSDFKKTYLKLQSYDEYKIDPISMGKRSLKNLCLGYLSELENLEVRQMAQTQFHKSNNMTDVVASLNALTHIECIERENTFKDFEMKWKNNSLVMDKWFSLQAISKLPNTLQNVKKLTLHPSYEKNNPNKIRSLISSFCRFNLLRFHASDGSGYEFLANQVLRIDPLNPQIAARLVGVFNNWRQFKMVNKSKMNDQLQKIIKAPKLSGDVFEIVSKALS